MPCYPMLCGTCKHEEELIQSIKLDLPKTCPKCGAETYAQNLEARFGTYNAFCDYANPKTLGQNADTNTRKLAGKRKEELQETAHKKKRAKQAVKKPWWKKVLGK